ncbi:glycosyltransferase [Jannaschia aquimarina]|uniref:glycosyltransferase n=1 Tax=Jannaschia aquimarina TaxID=935700 RepID=UPI001BAFC874|nr:glycosyltransferase [Jannaschia aquimarina]
MSHPRLAPVRKAAGAVARRQRQGPYLGFLDGLTQDGQLRGWVVDRRTMKGRVPVALHIGGEMVEAGYANHIREDVRAATGGEVECGFFFPLTDAHWAKIAQADGLISVRTHEEASREIGSLRLSVDGTDPKLAKDVGQAFRYAMGADWDLLCEKMDEVPEPEGPLPPIRQPAFERHGRMFDTDRVIPEIPLSGHPAYLDYVRYRYRMDESYQVEPDLESSERYLYWYLTAYRSQESRRVPLSRDLIEHLNEPMVMGSQSFTISRIMWWRLTGRPDLMANANLNDRDGYLKVLFWWAHQDAPHLGYEDCLVPDRFADLLRGVHPSRRLDAYPLSYFSECYFADTPKLHFLRPGTPDGRKGLALAMLLAAVQRPDLLRYMPRRTIDQLLKPGEDARSAFEHFLTDIAGNGSEPSPVQMSRDRYASILQTRFFDLDSYSFMTRDRNGNRFEAAALPPPNEDRPTVDVQLIGPLAKASGLGQATRLSADILRATGLDVRGVDFDLDNPAPEGFSSDFLVEEYGPAEINIIHLNAESIPLAFAYQPDVFSGAYNIGYFFWELDTPAYCHYLGMEMLDEIWVSTQYGVQIYRPDAAGKPVINVGMCYEDTPGIEREDARAYVERRFRFDESHFVVLVAFDSFSFVQRKNPVNALLAFQKAFADVPEARLVVKTQNRDSVFDPVQVALWDRVETIIQGDPRIVVINETLTYRDLLRLKAGSDIYLSLHKSEGWGFGMIEAMNLNVPVVCTGYSGNMDFCTPETSWLVDYEQVPLRHGDYIFVRPGSEWAEPSVDSAAQQLRAAYDDPAERLARTDSAKAFIKENFSVDAIARRYGDRLREILGQRAGRS